MNQKEINHTLSLLFQKKSPLPWWLRFWTILTLIPCIFSPILFFMSLGLIIGTIIMFLPDYEVPVVGIIILCVIMIILNLYFIPLLCFATMTTKRYLNGKSWRSYLSPLLFGTIIDLIITGFIFLYVCGDSIFY